MSVCAGYPSQFMCSPASSSSSPSSGCRRPGGSPGDRQVDRQEIEVEAWPSPQHSLRCAGVGSAVLSRKDAVYRYKALPSVKLGSLPQDCISWLEEWVGYKIVFHRFYRCNGADIILEWVEKG
jgi:hypothetical protein